MKYLKKYEMLNKLDTSDNPIFIEFMINFITSLDYDLTTNYNKKYSRNEIFFYNKDINSEGLKFCIEITNDELIFKKYHNNFKIIEEYLETINGLNLINIDHHIYNFKISGNTLDIEEQITKKNFDMFREANKFNL